MTRLFVIFLACGLAATAQQPTAISVIDAVALDAAGNPVVGLTAADFEIVAQGKSIQPLSLTAFDTIAHTAKTTTAQPALELTPDQIHRTTVIIIDDLCLSAASMREAKLQVRAFLDNLFRKGDHASILRTAGGSTRSRRITSDAAQLVAILNSTEPLGAVVSPQACAAAAWNAVTYAATGLESIAGRKAVVLMSGDVRPPAGNAAAEIARRASASMTAIYQNAAGEPGFAATTGGAAGVSLERVAAETGAYYALALPVAVGEVEVKVRRPGVSLGSRRRTFAYPLPPEFVGPPDEDDEIDEAVNSPFAASTIGVRATTLFTNTAAEGTVIEVLCHIDTRDLSYLRDEQGRYHLAFAAGAQNVLEAGHSARPLMGSKELHLSEAEYRQAVEDGLVVKLRQMWGAGPRDVRVVVADHRSGRMGSANAFTPSNSVESGNLFLSGIGVLGDGSVKQSPSVRVFRAGASIAYVYNIFNATVDSEGGSRVTVQSRLITGGRETFVGKTSEVPFAKQSDPKRHQLSGRIQLDPSIGAGRYIFQVTVVDQLAPQPRSASQFIDFTVEP
jgi:VWFA-related protein